MYGQNHLPVGSYCLYSDEVSFSCYSENYGRYLWVNFFQFHICSNPVLTGPPISLCLSTTFQSNNQFFDPLTQSLCEELLCQN
jgi:hypothetical protein